MAGTMAGTQTPRVTPDSLFSTDSGLLGEYVCFCVFYGSLRSDAIAACFTIPDVSSPYRRPHALRLQRRIAVAESPTLAPGKGQGAKGDEGPDACISTVG